MDILETQLIIKKQDEQFNKIQNIVNKYNKFLTEFTKGNYTNINLILEYLPDIIYSMIVLTH